MSGFHLPEFPDDQSGEGILGVRVWHLKVTKVKKPWSKETSNFQGYLEAHQD